MVEVVEEVSSAISISRYRHRTSKMLRQPITGVPAKVEVSNAFFINAAVNFQVIDQTGLLH